MTKKLMTGNEAVGWGALHAGAKVVTGYPGTPSSGALESLLSLHPANVHLEWSTNEKVAFEIAAGASWAGQRAMCTMKMSGLNVCYDSLISAAYSGCLGSLVIYVADDPGVSAGMAEQDSRGFAMMADLPMLEPASPAQAYALTQTAFEISERVRTPVFVRLVTSTASSLAMVSIADDYAGPPARDPVLTRDIQRFTKAGSAICMAQHRDLIARLAQAGEIIDQELRLNRLELSPQKGGLGIVAAGGVAAYLEEAMAAAAPYGFDRSKTSLLKLCAVHPFPTRTAQALLSHCDRVLVLEELEPYIERGFYVQAQKTSYRGRLIGKIDGPLDRVGEYGVPQVLQGITAALDLPVPAGALETAQAEALAAARPITVCAGCPHRGTFMALDLAIRKSGLKKDDVMVTGDIGCTILGMNPPFNLVWTELSMGASIGLAMGYAHAGVKTPVIATIGDSTFFHAGLPALANAVQYQVPLTVVILDNGWTSMTGMQVNPGTAEDYQDKGNRKLDIAQVVRGLGVDQLYLIDPFDLDASVAIFREAIQRPGVKVVLARQECVIPAMRRGLSAGRVRVIAENCNLCKLCIIATGCPAISLNEETVIIDPDQCYGCNLCGAVCNRDAIVAETGTEAAP